MATINPLPQADAAFMADLRAFLRDEDAERFALAWQGFVVSGGSHGPGAGLVGTPDPLVAFPAGIYTTETAGITYADNATSWVIADALTTGSLGSYTRVSGTHYLVATTGTQPAVPATAVALMQVTTSGGAVTAVQDLRLLAPTRAVHTPGIAFSHLYPTLQEAIDALPAEGGTLYITPGEYTLTSTLTLGNGAAATVSTRQGIVLVGLGAPYSTEFGYTDDPAVKLVWAGGADPVIKVAGPLAGWGIRNIAIDGADAASYGILVQSGQYGDVEHVTIRACQVAAIGTTTVTTFGGAPNTNTLHNRFANVFIDAPGDFGLELTSGAALSNTGYNTFDNVFVVVSGNGIGVQLAACSNNIFTNLHVTCGGGAAAPINLAFDNGQSDLWPAANVFFGLEPHDVAMTQTGTPAAALPPNFIVAMSPSNGALTPDVEGLAAIFVNTDGDLVLLPSRNAAHTKPIGDVVVSTPGTEVRNLIPETDNEADLGSIDFAWHLAWVSGGVATAVTTHTAASVTVTLAHHTLLADCTSNAVEFELPDATTCPGKVLIFKKIDASGNAMVIDPNGTQTIDGSATSLSLTTQWQTRMIQSNGTAWFRLDRP